MEIDERKEPGISGLVTGALIAAVLTASLIAFFYLGLEGRQVTVRPFDVFDWMTRIL